MSSFVAGLMKKMTLEEKIGQLNLITPGAGVPTGSVVNGDEDSKIKAGLMGGMFGISGVKNIRKAQELAVNTTRLRIPMIFGSDIIHGYRTSFPIPLASSWDMEIIEKTARTSAIEAESGALFTMKAVSSRDIHGMNVSVHGLQQSLIDVLVYVEFING
jgi:beta-glucosidase